ncbi:MAG: hypothetical protein KGV51_03140 [Moraxellaceae bacterium]|nr:hypothetical protein [Moraxellaceae bacterium]
MKKLLVILALLSSTINCAKPSEVTINNLSPVGEGKVFPKVSYAKNPKIADKINTFLQITLLKNVPNSSQNPFKNVQNMSWTSGHTGFYQWQRYQSPNNILSMKIVGIYTGAGLNDFELIYNFDLRNGKLIDIKDVINKQGLDFVVKTANNNMGKKITDFINTNKNIKNGLSSDERKAQIDMYQKCLLWINQQETHWFKHSFTKEGITFVGSRCSDHSSLPLDELGEFNIPISYQKLKPYLTQYGKSLIFNSPKNIQTRNLNSKIYQGKIGNYPIHLFVEKITDSGEVFAYYWYDKHKKMIDVRGGFYKNHFSLENKSYNEKLDEFIKQETIELDLYGNKLTGFWQDAKSKKKLKVELGE